MVVAIELWAEPDGDCEGRDRRDFRMQTACRVRQVGPLERACRKRDRTGSLFPERASADSVQVVGMDRAQQDARSPASTAPTSPFAFTSSPAPRNLAPRQRNADRTPSPSHHGAMSARHQQMKRFARSADKRQSVHMLGSIQHLQRHFVSCSR